MLWPFLLENDDGLSLAVQYAGRGWTQPMSITEINSTWIEETYVVDNMKFAGAVEVDDRHERPRMTIKKEFDGSGAVSVIVFIVVVVVVVSRLHRVVVTQLHQVIDGGTANQPAEPGLRQAVESGPGELVPLAADVDDEPGRRSRRPARRQRRQRGQSAGARRHHRAAVMVQRVRRRRVPGSDSLRPRSTTMSMSMSINYF